MIERYTRPEMGRIWTLENRYRAWLAVEVAVCEAWAELGRIPAEAVKTIRDKADIDVQRILDIEETTRHDVIAFLTSLEEKVGPEARFIHLGCTSSDIVDTANALLLVQAGKLILKDLRALLQTLEGLARRHKGVLCMGRTHGIHAEPTSFGLKMAGFHAEFARHLKRVEAGLESVRVGKISGAVGTYAFLSPELEQKALGRLGLKVDPHSTQIIQRDRYAHVISAIAVLAATCEKIAVAVRHFQRTEVYEAEEYFSPGQKGSSAMPHKRNPVLSENITGLCRMLRSYVTPALENVALWHERDISHSSVERFILPDAFITADFMLARITNLIANLVVYPENMMKNLNLTGGLVFSQRVLLQLPQRGISREDAYKIVQRNAMKVWADLQEGKKAINENGESLFLQNLLADEELRASLGEAEIKECFDYAYYARHVDGIFKRVFEK